LRRPRRLRRPSPRRCRKPQPRLSLSGPAKKASDCWRNTTLAGAVTELGKAFNLSKNPRFLLPLGLAFAEAGRPLDALDALGRFLKESPTLPDQKRREIGAKLGVMLDQVAGTVTVEATRQNAQIKLDGRVIGMSPLESPLRLNPGKHELQMVPSPTDPSSGATVVIDIRPGESKAVKLEPGARSRFLEPQVMNEDAGPGAAHDWDKPGRHHRASQQRQRV
jgi:hypothetical protein